MKAPRCLVLFLFCCRFFFFIYSFRFTFKRTKPSRKLKYECETSKTGRSDGEDGIERWKDKDGKKETESLRDLEELFNCFPMMLWGGLKAQSVGAESCWRAYRPGNWAWPFLAPTDTHRHARPNTHGHTHNMRCGSFKVWHQQGGMQRGRVRWGGGGGWLGWGRGGGVE